MDFDFDTLFERMDEIERSPAGHVRGHALEQLVADIADSLPGVRVGGRNVLAASRVEEVDLALINQGVDDGLVGFSHDVLVECKTQRDAVGSQAIGWFAQQLRRRHADWGILVSLSGVTGDEAAITAARREVERSAIEGQRILVLTGSEIRGIRSAAHAIALLQRKREAMVGGFHVWIASAPELRELNPDRGSRGWDVMRRAVRRERRRRLDALLDTGAALADLAPSEAIARAQSRLAELSAEGKLHRFDADYDPMWDNARSMLISAAAALVQVLDPTPRTDERRRYVRFEIESSAPQRLRAHPGGRLWDLLVGYYLDEMRRSESYARESAVYAVLAMCLDELMAIDDIEPPDTDEVE